MKIVVSPDRDGRFQEAWPGQFSVFSHLEFAAGIPQLLFAVTSYKQNGLPNVCLHSWSSFVSGKKGYYALLAGIKPHTHTYRNILRTGEFCLNFLGVEHMDALLSTVQGNGEEADELAAAGFTRDSCCTISCPSIGESFLTLECRLERVLDMTEDDPGSLIVGRVTSMAMEEGFSHGIDGKYGKQGFMYNVHSPLDLTEGGCDACGAASLHVDKVY